MFTMLWFSKDVKGNHFDADLRAFFEFVNHVIRVEIN